MEPPQDFIFNLDTRNKLLFEDYDFTYSKRYFWAYHTLGIMTEDINDIVMAYHDTFTDSVWEGTNKTIWPGEANTSSRHAQWRKRMGVLRADLDYEIKRLQDLTGLNAKKMQDISLLRESMFHGTTMLESRNTIQQNRNIRYGTIIDIDQV